MMTGALALRCQKFTFLRRFSTFSRGYLHSPPVCDRLFILRGVRTEQAEKRKIRTSAGGAPPASRLVGIAICGIPQQSRNVGLRHWFSVRPHDQEALPEVRKDVEEYGTSPTAAADSLPAFLQNRNGKRRL